MLTKVHICTGSTQRIQADTKVLPRKFEHAWNRELNKEQKHTFLQ